MSPSEQYNIATQAKKDAEMRRAALQAAHTAAKSAVRSAMVTFSEVATLLNSDDPFDRIGRARQIRDAVGMVAIIEIEQAEASAQYANACGEVAMTVTQARLAA